MKGHDFLRLLLPGCSTIIIRAVLENVEKVKANGGKRAIPFVCTLEEYPLLESQLHGLNAQGYGIYFVPNCCQTISEATAVFDHCVESDELSLEQQEENFRKFPLKPTFLIRTKRAFMDTLVCGNLATLACIAPFRRACASVSQGIQALLQSTTA